MVEKNHKRAHLEFFDLLGGLEWVTDQVAPPGGAEAIVYRDLANRSYCRALRLPVGFKGGDRPLHHDFDEIVYIISGSLVNTLTGKTYGPGSVAVFPRGTDHGPFAAPEGALTLEFRHVTMSDQGTAESKDDKKRVIDTLLFRKST